MAYTDGATYALDSFLKTVFLQGPIEQYIRDNVLINLLKKRGPGDTVRMKPGGGLQAQWALRTSRNGNGTAMSVEGSYPRAARQSGVMPYVDLKAFGKQVRVTTALMDLAKTDQQAFVSGFTDEFENCIEDFGEDISRQCWLDASGVIGTVASVTGASPYVITLDATAAHRWTPITRPFDARTTPRVEIQLSGTTITNGTGYISATDDSAGTITFTPDSGSCTILNTHTVVYEGGYNTELTGIESIYGTGNLYNVTVSSYPIFKASLVRTTQEDPTETNILRLIQTGLSKGAKYDCALTTWGVLSKYMSLLFAQKRFVNSVELKGGAEGTHDATDQFTGPFFNGLGPIIADNWCPQGTDTNTGWFVPLDKRYLFFSEGGKPQWDDKDGKVLKHLPGTNGLSTNYAAAYYWFAELCADRRDTFVIHKNFNALT